MKKPRALSATIRAVGSMFLLGASVSANAGWFGLGGTSWKEEVLLHDGSKIVVNRWIERGGRHEIGQLPPYQGQTLAFVQPITGAKIEWEDRSSDDLYTSNFLLVALDIVNETLYLVVTPMGCLSYNKWGRPNPPYVAFKHGSSAWERIQLSELPAEIRMPNLIISSPDTKVNKLGKDVVTASDIAKANTGFRQPEYRSIVREPIKPNSVEGSLVDCPDYNSPRYTSPKAPNPISPLPTSR